MSYAATELAPTLSSIESIKAYLLGLVTTASDNRDGEPVRLTYVGGEFAKTVGIPFEKHVTALAENGVIAVPKTRRKLVPFVQAYCADILSLREESAGTYFVSRSGDHAAEQQTVAAGREPASTQLRFHRAVWAAFIRPLDGSRRFLNLDQIGFTNAAEMPGSGQWREIEERFVLGAQTGEQVDGAELQKRIEDWAREQEVPISRLVVAPKQARELGRKLEQLFELIDALPAPLAEQWMIPAAVLKHLRNDR